MKQPSSDPLRARALDRHAAAAIQTARIRSRIRRELPPHAFQPCPALAAIALAIAAAIIVVSVTLATLPLPALAALFLALSCGGLYGSLFFLGHEVGHGAVVRSRRGQDVLMGLAFAIFLLSPTLWRVWHNKVHHTRTNREPDDPDNFGTLAAYHAGRSVRIAAALTPGAGRWLSLFYLPAWFTAHAQVILWIQSRRCPGFESLHRKRAAAESLGMAVGWTWLALQLGPWPSLLVILVPMMTANAIIMSYIATNHLLRPLVDHADPLRSSLSLTTHPWLDLIHFNFSHHVEHHLFPSMSSRYTPVVRGKLRRYAKHRFLAPPHLIALRLVFHTPRIHERHDLLVDPPTGRRASCEEIDRTLGAGSAARPTTRSCKVSP